MKPRVIIGYSTCEHTLAAFTAAGCDAWTCDLRAATHTQHLACDIWDALTRYPWDFAVLHPMCTYLTVSAAWAYTDGPYHQRVRAGTLVGAPRRAARDAALANFLMLLALPFPCAIENPAPSFVNRAIRPPDQVIQPWQFGDDASKRTGLWLTNGAPPLVLSPEQAVLPRITPSGAKRWANQTDAGQNNVPPSDERWLHRSRTYPGIAAAMGAQWGRWLHVRKVVL